MTTSSRGVGRFAPTALALSLLLCACTPKTPEQKAQEAARSAMEAARAANASAVPIDGVLSPAELAQAQQGVLRGYREDAARLSIHYFMNTQIDPDERRRWMALAAATGSSQAIQDDAYFLANSGEPGDCAAARALIAKAKTQYAREIAAATGQDWRDVKIEALERIRDQERQMAAGACGTAER